MPNVQEGLLINLHSNSTNDEHEILRDKGKHSFNLTMQAIITIHLKYFSNIYIKHNVIMLIFILMLQDKIDA